MDALQGGPVRRRRRRAARRRPGRAPPRARVPRRPRPRSGRASRRRSSRPARALVGSVPSTSARVRCTSAVASPERAGRLGEVGARLGGVQRHPPGVLDARQELLGEGEVPGCRLVALGARVRPVPGHRPDDGGHPARAGVDERALEDDVGVLAGREHPEDLDDERGVVAVGQVAVEDDRGVGLLAGEHPGGAHVHLGAPARLRHTGDRLLDGVGRLRRRGPHPALDELEQLGGVDRVVRAVVDPPATEHRVLHRADEGVVGAAERLAAVGEGHLVDDRLGAGLVGQDERLDAHLALRVVEPPADEPAQPGLLPLRGVPALLAHPALDELDLGRAEGRGGVDLSHGPHLGAVPARARRSRATRG